MTTALPEPEPQPQPELDPEPEPNLEPEPEPEPEVFDPSRLEDVDPLFAYLPRAAAAKYVA